jgi:hypothetical protein
MKIRAPWRAQNSDPYDVVCPRCARPLHDARKPDAAWSWRDRSAIFAVAAPIVTALVLAAVPVHDVPQEPAALARSAALAPPAPEPEAVAAPEADVVETRAAETSAAETVESETATIPAAAPGVVAPPPVVPRVSTPAHAPQRPPQRDAPVRVSSVAPYLPTVALRASFAKAEFLSTFGAQLITRPVSIAMQRLHLTDLRAARARAPVVVPVPAVREARTESP